jgi:hypothetical protein
MDSRRLLEIFDSLVKSIEVVELHMQEMKTTIVHTMRQIEEGERCRPDRDRHYRLSRDDRYGLGLITTVERRGDRREEAYSSNRVFMPLKDQSKCFII